LTTSIIPQSQAGCNLWKSTSACGTSTTTAPDSDNECSALRGKADEGVIVRSSGSVGFDSWPLRQRWDGIALNKGFTAPTVMALEEVARAPAGSKKRAMIDGYL
jgi:hypothetical protein